jgi:hypothetical protein
MSISKVRHVILEFSESLEHIVKWAQFDVHAMADDDGIDNFSCVRCHFDSYPRIKA